MAIKGKFITLEGVDGAGKSTHLAWLEQHLRNLGHELIVTREPGGTPLGETLRTLLLNESMHIETEALLMFAARREHLDKVIFPALDQGKWVVSDRFTDASFAYQCGGRGIDENKLEILENWVHPDFQPDLTLLFDVSIEVSQQRLANNNAELDRFEKEQGAFFQKVRQKYLDRAAKYPNRIKVVDSSIALHEIQVKLAEILKII